MKLSTKMRYGTRLLFELALNRSKGYMQLNEIAKREKISEKYLEQIVSRLKSSGLVQSQRGAQGGYKLSYEPEEINFFNIYKILEGPLHLVECLGNVICSNSADCPSQNIWKKINFSIEKELKNITLADMVNEYRKKESKTAYEI